MGFAGTKNSYLPGTCYAIINLLFSKGCANAIRSD